MKIPSLGHAKTLFLKYVQETFGEREAFFTVGGIATKSDMIDILLASSSNNQ
jgi:hypothetical protein